MTNPFQNIIPMTRSVPQSESSERAAISCLLQNFDLLNAMTWPDELFFTLAHRTILCAIRELHKKDVRTDFFAVQSLLERKGQLDEVGGMHGLMELQDVMPTGDPLTAAWHRQTLAGAARYRSALQAVRKAEGEFARQEGDIAAVSLTLSEIAAQGETARETTHDLLHKILNEMESTEPVEAFGSGLRDLDEVTTGGVKRGELLTIAAPTSGGKSILLVQMALRAIEAGKRVVFFSLEMPAKQVASRILSSMCGFNVNVLKYADRSDNTNEQVSAFSRRFSELSRMSLQIESGYSEMEQIDSAARELVAKGKADFIVVDYVQLVHLRALGSNETREQHVSEITKRLKSLALQLNIGVATASQLNDEGKLRESRAIAHHSDHVWFICPSDHGPNIVVNKNREGERGASIPVLMQGAISRFVDRALK